MKLPALSIKKRTSIFSAVFLGILAFALLLFFLKQVPRNTSVLHHHAFSILQNIKANIQERDQNRRQIYRYIFKEVKKKGNLADTIQRWLDSNNLQATVMAANHDQRWVERLRRKPAAMDKSLVHLAEIKGNSLVYKSNSPDFRIAIAEPADQFLNPILKTQKAELFTSYMLLQLNNDKKASIVYADKELGVRANQFEDSLFLGKKDPLFADYRPVRIAGQDFKMFFEPFSLEQQSLVLCGFVKNEVYRQRLYDISFVSFYSVAAIILLLIIGLPVAKLFFMNKDDHVTFSDLKLFVFSVFFGTALITLIVIQLLLIKGVEMRAEEKLKSLAAQVEKSFQQELALAYKQLQHLDDLVVQDLGRERPNHIFLTETFAQKGKEDISRQFKSWMATVKNAAPYFNYDRVFWVDSSGQQIIKVELGLNYPSFVDVSERSYFQALKNEDGYFLARILNDTIGFQPLYNWANGAFRIVISKKSRYASSHNRSRHQTSHPFAAVLSAQMYSLSNTVFPSGYGFCLIDEQGTVLAHSDMNRNLRENVFEKLGSDQKIKELINSRQARCLTQNLYGKQHLLQIQPVPDMPLFLLTYFDKSSLTGMNMRILIFAAIFSCACFLIGLALILLVCRSGYPSCPMLYAPMDCLRWLTPKKERLHFYRYANVFLLLYIVLFLLFVVLPPNTGAHSGLVLYFFVSLPVNVILGLLTLALLLKKTRLTGEKYSVRTDSRKLIYPVLINIALIAAIYFLFQTKFLSPYFFQLLVLILPFIAFLAPDALHKYSKEHLPKSSVVLSSYALTVSLCISVLAALPVCFSTWYAYNSELTQLIKKQQLSLAKTLQKRSREVKNLYKNHPYLPAGFWDTMQYSKGVYTIHQTKAGETLWANTEPQSTPDGQLYFYLLKDVSSYSEPESLPNLNQNAADKAWYWQEEDVANKRNLTFWYKLPGSSHRHGNINSAIKIVSHYPNPHLFLTISSRGIGLLLLVICLFGGLYVLVRKISDWLFLIRYVDTTSPVSGNGTSKHLSSYDPENQAYTGEYTIYSLNGDKEIVYAHEKTIINLAEKYKVPYSHIWKQCTKKEKCLLYDFAHDGLINYKNMVEIYDLISKKILVNQGGELKIFSPSFRGYILSRKESEKIEEMQKEFQKNSSWQAFQTPFLIFLFSIAVFIFFTQQTMFQQIIVLLTGLGTAFSLVTKMFTISHGKNTEKREV